MGGSVCQYYWVNEDGNRWMKTSDKIFADTKVDSSLAADRGIDLRKVRGGNLRIADAAHVHGREKTSHVADDAAAEGDQQCVALGAGHDHLLCQVFDGFKLLEPFPRRHEERYDFNFSRNE